MLLVCTTIPNGASGTSSCISQMCEVEWKGGQELGSTDKVRNGYESWNEDKS